MGCNTVVTVAGSGRPWGVLPCRIAAAPILGEDRLFAVRSSCPLSVSPPPHSPIGNGLTARGLLQSFPPFSTLPRNTGWGYYRKGVIPRIQKSTLDASEGMPAQC
jgi:hypothetical protein